MDILLEQIELALKANLYFVALMSALSVPDMAGALSAPDGRASGERYAAWYNAHARPIYREWLIDELSTGPYRDSREMYESRIPESPFTGDACYLFRCSLLHQGSTISPKSPYKRIVFVVPNTVGSTFHYSESQNYLLIDLPSFCREIVEGARRWLLKVQETAEFKSNYDSFARLHPNGFDPLIGGVPVIG